MEIRNGFEILRRYGEAGSERGSEMRRVVLRLCRAVEHGVRTEPDWTERLSLARLGIYGQCIAGCGCIGHTSVHVIVWPRAWGRHASY